MFKQSLIIIGRLSLYLGSFLLGVVLVYGAVNSAFFSPVKKEPVPQVRFLVEEGDDLKRISYRLEEQGLVKYWWSLYGFAKLKGEKTLNKLKKLSTGEYVLSANMTPQEILNTLIKGDVIYYQFTIPEGATVADIIKSVSNSGVVSKDSVALATNNQDLIQSIFRQQNPPIYSRSLEGFLFPETYRFVKPITPEQILTRLVEEGLKKFTPEMRARTLQLGMSLESVVTLASIIEKETAQGDERPIISSVFHNRMRIDMPLQSDPTVIYGLPLFDGNLTKEDLKTPSPYNTYLNKGLPPTPICNPGIEAIKAALYPADTNYLYFVAKQDGHHQFSTTYKEHREAVARYQKNVFLDLEEPKAKNNDDFLSSIVEPTPTPKATPTPKPKKTGLSQLDPSLRSETKKAPADDKQNDLIDQILKD